MNKDNSDVGKKWLDFGYILKTEPTSFPDRLNVRYKRKRRNKNDVKFVINWKKEISIYLEKKDEGGEFIEGG